jgi:hypothetical protein
VSCDECGKEGSIGNYDSRYLPLLTNQVDKTKHRFCKRCADLKFYSVSKRLLALTVDQTEMWIGVKKLFFDKDIIAKMKREKELGRTL